MKVEGPGRPEGYPSPRDQNPHLPGEGLSQSQFEVIAIVQHIALVDGWWSHHFLSVLEIIPKW